MQTVLNRLAARLGQGPFIADKQGRFRLTVDGQLVMLTPQGRELVLSTPLDAPTLREGNHYNDNLLRKLLQQVPGWARQAPQALVLDETGELAIEARFSLAGMDELRLQQAIDQQLALVEHLQPQLAAATVTPQWKQMIWHP